MPTNNTVTNVTVGKPNVSGAIYHAPLGSTLPTTVSGDLDAAFKCVGYISEDGVTNSNSAETESTKAWGGDVVLVTQTEKGDTFKFKMIEAKNAEVLKAVYGSANVTGALSTGITVSANSKQIPAEAWIIDVALSENAFKRIVIPNATLTELEDIVYKDSEALGYGVTISALPYASYDGDTHREFIQTVTNGG